ncbi:transposon protein [Musa troglodytarum]|uniref:Transposon protein n=1 Tax=Musa troglodytarum TaxID=320322 RepID=A0A9E7JIA9_9LILI|nr:transposon protein [Musa troglodytarum]
MGSRWGPLWRLPPLIPSTVMAILLVVADVGSDVAVKFLKVPPVFSASSSATFQFEVTEGRNGSSCHNCSINCKLDNYNSFACERKEVTYSGLLDGNHTFKICSSGSQGVRCASYNWTVDTVSPTAYISAASFTNALNVSVNISFSEPCTSGGGFKCSPSHCDLLVYGAGQVLPSTLRVLLPGLKFSFMVGISADVQFGRLVLAMDKVFCTDNAGNMFKQSSDSSFILHFDRRSVFMNLTSHIPERLLQLNGLLRTVQASNSARDLKIDLSFSEPVLNSSEEILDLLHASSGLLVPTNKSNLGNRRFGYLVQNISSMTVVTISCDTTYIITRQGTPVSPSDPITFLYVGAYSEIWERSKLRTFKSPLTTNQILGVDPSVHGKPLMPGEYMSFLENQNFNPEAEFIMISRNSDRWKHFGRNMFWLAIFGGGLTLLHVAILCLLKLRRRDSEKQEEYGALVFPRFELFLVMLALPCICQASAALIKGKTSTAIVVGVVLLGISTSFLISLLLFLSIGITMAKLLQYKEVHQEGQEFHWYQEFIRVTLGPGKRGQWTWTDQHKSINQTKLGPLFEDLRGPPKYMLTQISSKGNQAKHEDQDRIIASEDETEDAEAPFIQKLFGILRIYYTLLESIKRASLGILVGAYSSNRPSRIPTLIILSITSFQLFFLVLKKPFIKKKVQFVEIISVAGEVGLFGACLALLEKDFSSANERRIGFFMLALFIITFTAQLVNEWYALYRQVIRLSPTRNSFSSGLKRALGGLLLVVLPTRLSTNLTNQLSSRNGEGDSGITVTPIGQVQRTSGTSERSWLRQLREAAKTSFSREDAGAPIDPSSSTYQRSVFWSGKRSRSSSVTSSSDSKSKGDGKLKLRRLYKDLEAIFSSK